MADDGRLTIQTDVDESGAEQGMKRVSSVVGGAAKAMGAGIAVVSGAAVAAGSAIGSMAAETASLGDTIDKSSQKLGISREAYQEWDYILGQNGASISVLSSSMKKLTSDGKAQQEAFAELGITMTDSMSQEELFETTIKALQGVEDESERTRLATKLLGKGAQELAPLLNSGADATENLRKQAHDMGMVMSDETVAASANYTDAMDNLGRVFQGVKNEISGEFLPAITEGAYAIIGFINVSEDAGERLQNAIDSALEGLNDIIPRVVDLASNILTALLEGLTTALPSMFDSILPVIIDLLGRILEVLPNLVEMGVQMGISLINGIGDMLSQLPSLISSILQKLLEVITTAIPTILGVIISLITTTIPEILASIGEVVTSAITFLLEKLPEFIHMGSDLLLSLITGIANMLPQLANTALDIISQLLTAIMDNLPAILEAGVSLLSNLIEGITQTIPQIVSQMSDILTKLIDIISDNLPKILTAGIEILMSIISGLLNALPDLVKMLPKIISTILDVITKNLPTIIKLGFDILLSLINGIIDNLPSLVKEVPKIIKEIVETLLNWDNVGMLLKAGLDIIVALAGALIDNLPELAAKVPELIFTIINTIKEYIGDMQNVGMDIINGLWEGLKDKWDDVTSWFGNACDSVVDSVKDLFGIHSPSRVFKGIGKNLAEGLGEGFVDEMDGLAVDMQKAIPSVDLVTGYDLNQPIRAMVSPFQTGYAASSSVSSVNSQTININAVAQTPDQIARAMRVESHYGLAGAR